MAATVSWPASARTALNVILIPGSVSAPLAGGERAVTKVSRHYLIQIHLVLEDGFSLENVSHSKRCLKNVIT